MARIDAVDARSTRSSIKHVHQLNISEIIVTVDLTSYNG